MIGSEDPLNVHSEQWPYGNPERGNLDHPQLQALCSILAEHTETAGECYFGLWEGYGWIHGSPAVAGFGSTEPIPPAFPASVMNGPRVRLPGRDYLLFVGQLEAALDAGWHPQHWTTTFQSPNLFWPTDRTFCVATEIDFDSTLVAGSASLIDRILEAPTLDAWPVSPTDSLAYDADRLNGDLAAP